MKSYYIAYTSSIPPPSPDTALPPLLTARGEIKHDEDEQHKQQRSKQCCEASNLLQFGLFWDLNKRNGRDTVFSQTLDSLKLFFFFFFSPASCEFP